MTDFKLGKPSPGSSNAIRPTARNPWSGINPGSEAKQSVRDLAKGKIPQTPETIRECVGHLLSDGQWQPLHDLLNALNTTSLDLSGMKFEHNGDLAKLVEVVHGTAIEALSLSHCGLNDEVCDAIGALLTLPLKALDLSGNRLRMESAKAIRAGLSNNDVLEDLNLSENRFKHDAFAEIMGVFTQSQTHSPRNQTLQTIRFDGNKDMFEIFHQTGKRASAERKSANEMIDGFAFVKNPTRISLANTQLPANNAWVGKLFTCPEFQLRALDLSGNPYQGDKAILELVHWISASPAQNLELSCRDMKCQADDNPLLNSGGQFLWLAHRKVSVLDLTGTTIGTAALSAANPTERDEGVREILTAAGDGEAKQFVIQFRQIQDQLRTAKSRDVNLQILRMSSTCPVARQLNESLPRLPFTIELVSAGGTVASIHPVPAVFNVSSATTVTTTTTATTTALTTATTTMTATAMVTAPATATVTTTAPDTSIGGASKRKPPLKKTAATQFDRQLLAKLPIAKTGSPSRGGEKIAETPRRLPGSAAHKRASTWGTSDSRNMPGRLGTAASPPVGLHDEADTRKPTAKHKPSPTRFHAEVHNDTAFNASPLLGGASSSFSLGPTANPARVIPVAPPVVDKADAKPPRRIPVSSSSGPGSSSIATATANSHTVAPTGNSPSVANGHTLFSFMERLGVSRQVLQQNLTFMQTAESVRDFFEGDSPVFSIGPAGDVFCNRLPPGTVHDYGPLLNITIANVSLAAYASIAVALSKKLLESGKHDHAAMTMSILLSQAVSTPSFKFDEKTIGQIGEIVTQLGTKASVALLTEIKRYYQQLGI